MASSTAVHGQPALLGQLQTQQLCLFVYSLASLGCTDGKAVLVCLDEVAARGAHKCQLHQIFVLCTFIGLLIPLAVLDEELL